MNIAVMMKRDPLLSLESKEKVMIRRKRGNVLHSTLNECLCCLGTKTDITHDNYFPSQTITILLNQHQIPFIKDVLQARDFMNKGFLHHQAVILIPDISSSTSKEVENRFNLDEIRQTSQIRQGQFNNSITCNHLR